MNVERLDGTVVFVFASQVSSIKSKKGMEVAVRPILSVAALTFACCFSTNVDAQPVERPKLVVLPLAANGVRSEAAKILDALVINQVDDLSKYEVIEISDAGAMLGVETAQEAIGCVDVACAAKIGDTLGVDRVLVGSVSSLGGLLLVSLKLIDVRAQAVESRSQVKAADDEKLYVSTVERAVAELFGVAPPRPAVVEQPVSRHDASPELQEPGRDSPPSVKTSPSRVSYGLAVGAGFPEITHVTASYWVKRNLSLDFSVVAVPVFLPELGGGLGATYLIGEGPSTPRHALLMRVNTSMVLSVETGRRMFWVLGGVGYGFHGDAFAARLSVGVCFLDGGVLINWDPRPSINLTIGGLYRE